MLILRHRRGRRVHRGTHGGRGRRCARLNATCKVQSTRNDGLSVYIISAESWKTRQRTVALTWTVCARARSSLALPHLSSPELRHLGAPLGTALPMLLQRR